MNNFPNKEKIRRQIYKSEELKKKKENQEKLKYPALNGLINKNNIDTYFIFGEEEDNSINNDSNIQIEYEICSFFNNEEVPDLYTPFGIISGNNYKIIPVEEENQDKNDNGIDSLMDNDVKSKKKQIKNENNNKNIKNIRYFDMYNIGNSFCFEEDENISICNKCGKDINSKCNCNNQSFCHICLSKNHIKKNCPKFNKCNKCLKYGHMSQNCTELINSVCEKCKIANHNSEDCLRYPNEITVEDIKENNLKCEFFGSENHILCPYSEKENYIILYEDKENDISFNKNDNDIDFSNKLYCPTCGENHLKKECPEKRENKAYSDKSEIKSINSDTNNNINNIKDDDWGCDDKKSNFNSNNKNKEKDSNNKENPINSSINFEIFQSWGEDFQKDKSNLESNNERKENDSQKSYNYNNNKYNNSYNKNEDNNQQNHNYNNHNSYNSNNKNDNNNQKSYNYSCNYNSHYSSHKNENNTKTFNKNSYNNSFNKNYYNNNSNKNYLYNKSNSCSQHRLN